MKAKTNCLGLIRGFSFKPGTRVVEAVCSAAFHAAIRNVLVIPLLLLLALPAVAQAQFNYVTNNGTITITQYTGPGRSVVIPDTINGYPVANSPLVIEASTGLANPAWIPLQSCTLTNGSIYFSDPQWTNYPGRFYRVRWP